VYMPASPAQPAGAADPDQPVDAKDGEPA